MEKNIRRRKRESVSKKGKLVRIRRNFGLRGGNLAGVCEGLGAYFDVQPLVFRLGFIAFSFFSGFGILAYLGMAIALPDEKGESLYQTIMERIREEKSSRKLEGDDWETEEYQLCDNCDTVVKFDAKFCHHCGHKL
jgi:phage shock protein C